MKFTLYRNRAAFHRIIIDEDNNEERIKLGAINLQDLEVSDELLASLTAEEREELRQWIESHKRFVLMQKEVTARNLIYNIKEAQEWILATNTEEAMEVYEAIKHEYHQLNKAVKALHDTDSDT